MNVLSLNGKRGKKETFPYGDDYLSITELLKKPEVVNFVERDDGPLTYAPNAKNFENFYETEELINNWLWTTQHRTHRRCKFKITATERNDEEQTFR